ncbi:hypothetical protein B0H10DRAFT_2206734 [Mycena sp. CBHHK59/15]|nr:hypothetical protein B0H10DRAFT_2206734 [Mycena sp. CBHHK59/15]
MPPIRTKAQRAQSLANLMLLREGQPVGRGSDKENHDVIAGSPPASAFSQEQLDIAKARGDAFRQKARNETRRRVRAQESAAALKKELSKSTSLRLSGLAVATELRMDISERDSELSYAQDRLAKSRDRVVTLAKQKDALRMQKSRALGQKAAAVAAASIQKASKEAVQIKDHGGLICLPVRSMVRDLVSKGHVTEENVDAVFKRVAEVLDVNVVGNISRRSSARIVGEGGIAAKVQLVHELERTQSFTASGDGSSFKNIPHEGKHIILDTESYSSLPLNHKSETQLEGWKDTRNDLYRVYNASPLGVAAPAEPLLFSSKLRGMSMDHAADQKKLFVLALTWREEDDMELRGRRAVLEALPEELLDIMCEENDKKIAAAGGIAAWETLSVAEKDKGDLATYRTICMRYGMQAWGKLSPEQQYDVRFCQWGGCSMHKEMNSVKGGAAALRAYWERKKLEGFSGPVLLANRDNARTIGAGRLAAKTLAEAVTTGGAVKLTDLAGAVFHHKDIKKGQQDSLHNFFEKHCGYMVRFPSTSNIRYQSHCEASAELTYRLDLYIKFLELVRDKKIKGLFNNMEANVYKGLQCKWTVMEMEILSWYLICYSNPYMSVVRGKDHKSLNLLDLGPLHDLMKAHCRLVIDNPNLLLSPTASYETATLDSKPFQRPEIFYMLQSRNQARSEEDRVIMRELLIAFLTGALETWERFTTEFEAAKKLSPEDRRRAFMRATNDANEGKLGEARRAFRNAPSLSIDAFNSRAMYRTNNTANFIAAKFGPEDEKFLRKTQREEDSSGRGAHMRIIQADAEQQLQDTKKGKDLVREANTVKRKAEIDGVRLVFDIDEILRSPGNAKTVVLQLKWHKRHDTTIPNVNTINKLSKDDKVKLLVEVVTRYLLRPQEPSVVDPVPGEAPVIDDGDGYLSDGDLESEQELYH